ncbi:protein rolling stone-like isoform X2 [Choristoneura fumiferana]|uniref:protein rolling stone-like isoform X2 n=1 Tax=Choristoneura fumiferana TaxID=7141 RepID=UPI003D1574E5
MSAIRTYFKEEAKVQMLVLAHPKPSDFYLSVWQTTRSAVPLLIWRALLFLASLGIVLSSLILYIIDSPNVGYWFIYLTHWGITINTFATGFALAVSVRCYFYGPLSGEFLLPWYVKTYWILYNTAIPLAFLITIFYWSVLYGSAVQEELNPGLDIAIHGLNSLVMFGLLMSASQPSRMWHIYQPIQFAFVYVIFGVIYWAAGGTDAKGNKYIYPVIDWSSPGPTIGVVALTGLMLIVLHFMVMGMAVGRDALASRLFHDSVTVHVEEGVPLRQRPSEAQTAAPMRQLQLTR